MACTGKHCADHAPPPPEEFNWEAADESRAAEDEEPADA